MRCSLPAVTFVSIEMVNASLIRCLESCPEQSRIAPFPIGARWQAGRARCFPSEPLLATGSVGLPEGWNLFKKNGFHLTAKRIPSDHKIAKSFGIVQCGNPIRYVPMSKTRKVVTSAISVIHKFVRSTTLRYIGRIDLLMTETFRQRFKKSILVISLSTHGETHTLHGMVFSPMRIFFYYY